MDPLRQVASTDAARGVQAARAPAPAKVDYREVSWLSEVDWLVCDLDLTLYLRGSGLMLALDRRFTEEIARRLHLPVAEADTLRRRYYQAYGSTVAGLVRHHRIDPEAFLRAVHDLPVEEHLAPDRDLACLLDSLHARKILFTNAPEGYARRVLETLGVAPCFEAVYDITFCQFRGKPEEEAYTRVLEALGSPNPRRVLFVDDSEPNLRTARAMGWRTLRVGSKEEEGRGARPEVSVPDLAAAGWFFERLGILDRSHRSMRRRCAARCHPSAVPLVGPIGTPKAHGAV